MVLSRHQGNGITSFIRLCFLKGFKGIGGVTLINCLYTKRAKDESLLILILYVDDMLLAKKSTDKLVALLSKLNDNFDMKDLGDANHILGMRIVQDKDKRLLYLSQTGSH
ncbi:hypothetical protein L7F22_047334 [Adiantum nelumboides]|nr:hypothetical protein [Adiantum nelumboides]